MCCAPSGPFGALLARGRVVVLLVVTGMVLGGCTATSFLGRQYTDFTAYYNKFYNAENAFEEGLEQMTTDNRSVDRSQYLSIFRKPTGTASSSFEKAIQKSADVLREHPNSKWVDDALVLIGKSYFYQQNYVGATQKFREAIALDTKRAEEARFWLARTLLEVERYEEAAKVIRSGEPEEATSNPWTARLSLVQGTIHANQQRWEAAAQALNRGLQGDLPDRLAARASFLLGQTLETLENPASARAAYREVQAYDPPYSLGLAARLSDIELQGQHGDAERALGRLSALADDDKNYEQRGDMALVRARIYRANGQYEAAKQALRGMLYREDAPSGAGEGRLHYDLARLYRDVYEDFSQAAAHFDTAKTALDRARGRGADDVQRLPGAPQDVAAEANRYSDLASRAREVARMDSLLRVGRMSDRAFRRFVGDLRRQQREQREARDDSEDQPARRLGGGEQALVERRRGTSPASNTGGSDAGFLFHKDPARVQQGKRQFEQTWGERPLVDNWRRREAIRTASSSDSGDGEDEEVRQQSDPVASEEARPQAARTQEVPAEADALDLSAIPRDSVSQAKMEAERAVTRYELANSLFLAAGRPDSAATWYRRILQENGDHPVARRALYALAEAYRAQEDTTAAQQAYRRLIDQYPNTDLAARARQRLGRQQPAPTDNRAALADSAYARAYQRWQEGRLATVLPDLLDVAARYPDTDAAPRALLAAGLVYWKEVQRDSTARVRPVLVRGLRAFRPGDSTASVSTASPDSVGIVSDAQGADSMRTRAPEPRSSPPVSRSGSSRQDAPPSRDSLQGETASPPERPPRPPRPDTTRARGDSVLTARGTEADSSRRALVERQTTGNPYAPLDTLLTYLTDRYPEAPQVKRAQTILDVIDQHQSDADSVASDTTTGDPPAADTTGDAPETIAQRRGPADSLSQTTRDTSRAPPEGRSDERGGATEREALPAPTGVTRDADESDQEGIARDQGGWTLRVRTLPTAGSAATTVKATRRRVEGEWPVDVVVEQTDDGPPKHHVVMGQFDAEETAEEAKERAAEMLSRPPTVWAIPAPPSDS